MELHNVSVNKCKDGLLLEEESCTLLSDKELKPKVYKEHIQLNNNNNTHTYTHQLKVGEN